MDLILDESKQDTDSNMPGENMQYSIKNILD